MEKAKLLRFFSCKQLAVIKKILPGKYKDTIEKIRMQKFIEQTDFSKINTEKFKRCVVKDGEWAYPLFQMSCLNNMLSNIIYSLSYGYIPSVQFKDENGINLWEQFLIQPFGQDNIADDSLPQMPNAYRLVSFPSFPTEQDVKTIHNIAAALVIPNKETAAYIENEYDQVIRGKSVIGVLVRGTDYTANRPKGHPVQPSIEAVIDEVRVKLDELHCDYIYVATEEEALYKQFADAFSGRVLSNRREYYDSFYDIKKEKGDSARISQVHHNRENDNYLKSLEYLSSLYLLSRCDALIAGNCGGSRAALYLNGGNYKYYNLFNLGLY